MYVFVSYKFFLIYFKAVPVITTYHPCKHNAALLFLFDMSLLVLIQVRVIDDDIKLAQFAVGFKGAAASDRDSIVFMVMRNMLGSLSKQPTDIDDHGSVLSFVMLLFYTMHTSRKLEISYVTPPNIKIL